MATPSQPPVESTPPTGTETTGEVSAPGFDTRAILAGFAALGLDVDLIQREARLDAMPLGDADARVPDENVERMWASARAQWRRPNLALHTGASVPFGAYQVIDYMVSSSATVAEGFHRLRRYFALITARLQWTIIDPSPLPDPVVELRRTDEGLPSDGTAETYTFAVTLTHLRNKAPKGFAPVAVHLPHHPEAPHEYEEIFACPVSFGAEVAAVHFRRDDWLLPLVDRDPKLLVALERHAEELLTALPSDGLTGTLRRHIVTELRGGNPSIEHIATRLHMSTRTLQRRLKEHGVVYQHLVDELRRGLAEDYLAVSSISVAEVAYLLGYSEPSAFHRAFKRWTGRTPQQFRRTARSS